MNEVVDIKTGRKKLTADQVFKNSTESGQTKVVIGTMDDDGNVGVWTTDMSPMELLYIVESIEFMAGGGAVQHSNAYTFPGSTFE